MWKLFRRPVIDDVWTPRREYVNHDMFVEREHYQDLVREMGGDYNLIVHGHSGCGKSWLYQKAFADQRVRYVTINCSDLNFTGNIQEAYKQSVRLSHKIAVNPPKKFSFGVGIKDYYLNFSREIDVGDKEFTFHDFVAHFSKFFRRKKFFIVFENFEHVIHLPAVIDGIGVAIMSKGDANYRRYKFKVLIVGVSTEYGRISSHFKYSDTIRTRLREIHEVLSLTEGETYELLDRGFVRRLGFEVQEKEQLYRAIYYYSDGVPLMIHDLAKNLSHEAESSSNILGPQLLPLALYKIYRTSEFNHSEALEEKLYDRGYADTKIRALFELSQMKASAFTVETLEELVRENQTIKKYYAGAVSDFLTALCREPHPIMRYDDKLDVFYISNPTYKTILKYIIRDVGSGTYKILTEKELKLELESREKIDLSSIGRRDEF